MKIRQEKSIDLNPNNFNKYKKRDVFYKVFEENGKLKKVKISEEEAKALELEGFPLTKVISL